MKNRLFNYFTKFEMCLFIFSLVLIISTFVIFDRVNYLTLISSLIGVTSLILAAKGNPISQILIIIFSIQYSIISWQEKYYGEIFTYIGMTLPMAVLALVEWIKHPYKGNKHEVEITLLCKKDILLMFFFTLIVTFIFYFILLYTNTSNLIVSTISITTSFIAVYLTYKRSPYYAIGYALNDIVLIVLWIYASIDDLSYISVIACFVTFLINDIYGFVAWVKMRKRQLLNDWIKE